MSPVVRTPVPSPACTLAAGLLAALAIVPLPGHRTLAGEPQAARATASATRWTMPRTPDGRPDLQGTWTHNAITPLERPKQLAEKSELTDEEFAELQVRVNEVLDGGDAIFLDDLMTAALMGNKAFRSTDRNTGNYSQVWLSDRVLEKRTSLIVDPSNGRIPALTQEAQARNAARAAARRANPPSEFEALGATTRCITMGVPSLWAGYNSYFEFVQSPDHVVLRMEMIHDARIIPIDGRPHLPDRLRQLHGDSRGRWDGDTLVVETRNFSPRSNFRGSNENLHLVERFTRIDADTIDYLMTLSDPTTWVQPWTILVKLRRSDEPIHEYACHEGNRGMEGILSAQRAAEAR